MQKPQVPDLSEVHEVIGEFVVFFQSVEDTYREIGWFMLDPERKDWPPKQFRTETNRELIDKVTDKFLALTRTYSFPNGDEKAAVAEELRIKFHALRKYRNRLIHSTFHEVVAGGQVVAILRTNPKMNVDVETGQIIVDEETFTPETVRKELSNHVVGFFQLHAIQKQLIHWSPFGRYSAPA